MEKSIIYCLLCAYFLGFDQSNISQRGVANFFPWPSADNKKVQISNRKALLFEVVTHNYVGLFSASCRFILRRSHIYSNKPDNAKQLTSVYRYCVEEN